MVIKAFFKNAFSDMAKSARAQKEVSRAEFEATKSESKARHEEAKAMGDPARRKGVMQAKRDEQIRDADKRRTEAEARIYAVKK